MNIAVIIGWVMYENQTELFNGICDSARKNDINLFLFTCSSGKRWNKKYTVGELNIYTLPDFSAYDGVIADFVSLESGEFVEYLDKKIREAKVPAVCIGEKREGFYGIELSEKNSMIELVNHMIEVHQCRKFYYISGKKDNYDEQVRRSALLEALHAYNLDLKPEHIYPGNFSVGDGINAVNYFMNLNEPLADVIVAGNDLMAIEACIELQKHDIRVPEDVKVTGVDGIKDAAISSPRITTIRRPRYQMGYEALEWFAKDMLRSTSWAERKINCNLVFTESCGCGYHNEITSEDFRKNHILQKFSGIDSKNLMDEMSADLTAIEGIGELVENLKKYIERINPERFYLCMCNSKKEFAERLKLVSNGFLEDEREISSYCENIHIYLAYEDGEFKQYPAIKKNQLLPEPCEYKSGGNFFAISPLHFMNRCYGYLVFGNSDFAIKNEDFGLFRSILGMHFENTRKKILLNNMVNQLEKKWIIDPLTNIYNRSGFYKNAETILDKCKDENKKAVIFFFDIDGLKQVNDRFGHEQGDFLIRSVSKMLVKSCKTDNVMMRYGGDEFVLLTEGDGEKEAEEFIDTLRENLRKYNEKLHKPYDISVSIGYILAEVEDDFSIQEMIHRADEKMYQEKNKRKRLKDLKIRR